MPRGAVLLDLSGTVHVGSTLLPGAAGALNLLRSQGWPFMFVSNTTKMSSMRLHRQLTEDLGLDIDRNQILTPLVSAKLLLKSRGLRNPFLILNDEAKEEFDDLSIDSGDYDSVVLGLAPSMFCYEHLNTAFRLIRNGRPLIALHKGRYFASGSEELSLGPGAFAAALEYSTGVEAEVVGKPTLSFYELAAQELGCSVGDCYMVGDDVKDDILGSLDQAGLKGAVLVQSGKYREGDEDLLTSVKDRFCTDATDVQAAVELILKNEANDDR